MPFEGVGFWPLVSMGAILGGTIVDTPDAVSWGHNRIDAFAPGTDNHMWHRWWDGTAWGPSVTDWEYMDGTILDL